MKLKQLAWPLGLFVLIAFGSCKKNEGPEEEKPAVLSSKDPQKVSAAVKVWHGQRVAGDAPSPRGTGLQLDASAPITHAFAGRYAIIQPAIAQGDVEGYYLQINGATEHFKIDYSTPRGGRIRAGQQPASPFAHNRDSRAQRTYSGNADSAIVIALPASLQVPDTICMSYWAYDAQGNISTPVSTCVVINSVGTTAAGNWVQGSWRITAGWGDSAFLYRDSIIYNKWYSTNGYTCQFNPNIGNYELYYNDSSGTDLVNDSMFVLKYHLAFGTNGGMAHDIHEKTKHVDRGSSTCTQFNFSPVQDYTDSSRGAWNYNPTTGKMVLVFEYDDASSPTIDAWEYTVWKLATNHMILVDDADPSFRYYIRLEK